MRADLRDRRIVTALVLAALLVPALAQSASPLPSASTAGQTTHILTNIQNLFLGSMGGWLTHAPAAAQDLFSGLAVFELMWVGIQWALKRSEPHELIGSLAVKIAFFALFYLGVIGMGPHWIPLLLHVFQRAGLVVTGMSGQQANALTPANPSAIFGQSWDAIQALGAAVTGQVSLMHPIDDVLMGFSAVASAIVFVLAYALLAFEALMINIEASVILGAGVFMVAFSGSNWTTTFSEKYLSYVFSIGVKYFVLTVILALGAGLPTTIQHVFQAMNAQGGYGWITPIEASFMTLVYGVVGLSAPGIAGSVLSGSPSLSTGSFMSAAAGGAGVAAAGGAGVAAAGGAGVAAAGGAGVAAAGLGAAAGVAGLAGSGGMALAAMAKRLGGGSGAVGGIAGDMGAMGMLGSMAGTNRGAGGGGGGVAGLARALGPGSSGPATGSIGRAEAWTVDSAGAARPTPPGGSARPASPEGSTRPAGAPGASAGGPAPNIRFGDRGDHSTPHAAGAGPQERAAPGQGPPAGGTPGGVPPAQALAPRAPMASQGLPAQTQGAATKRGQDRIPALRAIQPLRGARRAARHPVHRPQVPAGRTVSRIRAVLPSVLPQRVPGRRRRPERDSSTALQASTR